MARLVPPIATLTSFEQLDRHYRQVVEALRQLQQYPSNLGSFIQKVSLQMNTRNVIRHTLGRKMQGYQVIRQSANAIIWDETANDESSELWLQTNNPVVVSLLVF